MKLNDPDRWADYIADVDYDDDQQCIVAAVHSNTGAFIGFFSGATFEEVWDQLFEEYMRGQE